MEDGGWGLEMGVQEQKYVRGSATLDAYFGNTSTTRKRVSIDATSSRVFSFKGLALPAYSNSKWRFLMNYLAFNRSAMRTSYRAKRG